MKKHIRYRTVFISDVHLGFTDCKIEQVNHFLTHTRCDKLVLNGDIIDGWHLKGRGKKWKKHHTKFFRIILKKVEKHGTEVIYLRGNHDDFLWSVLPLQFGNIKLANEHIHEQPDKRYICVHGDGFDGVTTNHPWIAKIGSMGYSALLVFNRFYNWYRKLRGRPYYSLSKKIKAKVKGAVSFVGRYEEQLQTLAKEHQCDGIICGHIHTPADKQVGDIHYMNSGDWVESMTAIVEGYDHKMELISYDQFCDRLALVSGKKSKGKSKSADANDSAEPLLDDTITPLPGVKAFVEEEEEEILEAV
ncbi:MAG: UDP-2,3-diacylglucosamine diphosphatase [Verrucomicrobiota bacterium]